MSLRTIEQERALFAYNEIDEVERSGNKDYKSLVRGFASMILQNGLGQALAFLRAKGKSNQSDHHNILYRHINEWLKKDESNFDILNKIVNGQNEIYRLYTKETLAFLVWLKKFAEAELPDKKDNR